MMNILILYQKKICQTKLNNNKTNVINKTFNKIRIQLFN